MPVLGVSNAEFRPGELLVLGDHLDSEEGNHRFHLGRFKRYEVMEDDDDPESWIKVDYLGTTVAKSPYRFRKVWIDRKDGRPIIQDKKPKPGKRVSKEVHRWVGSEHVSHVLMRGLTLTQAGGLQAATLKALGEWRPHVL